MPFSESCSYPFSIHVHTNRHYLLSPADLLFHSSPTSALDLLSTSSPLILPHIYFSLWLFQFFSRFLSHSGLGTMSRFHNTLLISHSFLHTLPLIFRGNFFPQSKSWHSLNHTHANLVLDVTFATHPPPQFILSPRYEHSVTVSTSPFNFSF